jgi:ferrous iron transport protein B
MRLSDLITGQEAYISEITGEGAIKHRIHEMGFVGGKKVKAIKSAPFKDPVEYDIMGYKLTIRRKDAEMIIVEPDVPQNSHLKKYKFQTEISGQDTSIFGRDMDSEQRHKTFTVALVGNPNCGKTSIFNLATNSRERVANYSGVTVAAKEASIKLDGYTIKVIDLPGTYSLKPYSPEEWFVYDYLINHSPDLVINVIDAGNLERNLFLTTQLIDLQLNTIIALNMFDELEKNNKNVDYQALGQMLGIPFVPTIGKKGKGLKELFHTLIEVYEGRNDVIRKAYISYGKEIDTAITNIQDYIRKNLLQDAVPNKFVAIQILEGSTLLNKNLSQELNILIDKERINIEKLLGNPINAEIVNTRYGYIHGALAETYLQKEVTKVSPSHKIDSFLTHKILGLPVFFGIIWFIFYATFKLGQIPMEGIGNLFVWLSGILFRVLPENIFSTMLIDGVIGGVGGVIEFLPNIMILFFLISFLEDSGYMARTAFLMDKTMHKVGLHGKSFIPLLMGFGCNIPAILATRTIEGKKDRIVTMFITPFMSCSARLPVYVLFISAFFPTSQSLILFSIYGIGILAAWITALILNKTVFRKTESPFVMELPPYRVPTFKAITKHTWFKTSHFIKKMGTVILLASIIVWALGYFPRNTEIIAKYDSQISMRIKSLNSSNSTEIEQQINELEASKESELLEQSYISRVGKVLGPIFRPLGFDWKMSVGILTGVMAKEVVVSSMGILYHAGANADESSQSLISKLQYNREQNQIPLSAYLSFLVFILLYFPCLGTLIAIKKEISGFKWTLFAAIYPIVFAWITSFIIYQTGNWF